MLVRIELTIANQYSVKTYVTSEPDGLKVYLNHVFKLDETVSVDYSQYGGTEPVVEHVLDRDPIP